MGVCYWIAGCLLISLSISATPDETQPKMETVLIQGGTFTMGTPIIRKKDPEYHADETRLEVTVGDFRIGKHPVTAEQMCAFLNSPWAEQHDKSLLYNHQSMGGRFTTIVRRDDGQYAAREGADKAPANQVTWLGAALYCKWLSETSRKTYRLPTEAEWELAARGTEGRIWPWGDSAQLLKLDEPFPGYIERTDTRTVPVGTRPENATPEGVHDLLAYVIGEWCTNKYTARLTPARADNKEVDLEDLNTSRVVRGYYHRLENRKRTNFISWFFLPEVGHHPGRVWTRVGCHPIDEVQQAARHGFRVVEAVAVED